MGDGCEEEFPAPTKSQVKDLIFEHSQFDDGALSRILKNVEALQRFSYAAGGATVSYDFVAPKRVIKSLTTYAGHSLENMILDFTDDDGGEDVSIMIMMMTNFEIQLTTRSWRPTITMRISLSATSRP